MWTIILITLASSLAINTALFLIAFKFQSDKLTDISYAISFLTIDVVSFIYAGKQTAFTWIIFALPALWSVRIGSFLLIRVLIVGKDRRFDGIREKFTSFSKFWLGQAMTAWVLMLPVTIAMYRGGKVSALVMGGLLIWLIGIVIEALADYQKFVFKLSKNNVGNWIDNGLWKYSRHPNYLGEILVWCGIYVSTLIALNTFEKLIGLASPLLISFVLLFISGVPLLEKSADKRWGKRTAYQDYKKRTRLLIPLPK